MLGKLAGVVAAQPEFADLEEPTSPVRSARLFQQRLVVMALMHRVAAALAQVRALVVQVAKTGQV